MNDPTTHFIADLITGKPARVADVYWPVIGEATDRYRLAGLAHGQAWLQPLPAAVARAWEAAYRAQAIRAQLLAEEWAAVRAALASGGIGASLVKGAWLNDRRFYRGGERALDDIDVVVSRGDGPAAARILQASGWLPWDGDPSASVRWAGAATFHPRGQGRLMGLAVDLHAGLDYGSVRASSTEETVGLEPRALDAPEAQLVIAVEHFLKHWRVSTHLSALSDVARLLRTRMDLQGAMATLRAGKWGEPGAALVHGVADWMGAEFSARALRADKGNVLQTGHFRIPSIVADASSRPGRLPGVGGRWILRGPAASARECADALFPPAAWLRDRYGTGRRVMGNRLRHLTRMAGWVFGAASSPLSPNQE